jgi:glutamate carboxypeptidase
MGEDVPVLTAARALTDEMVDATGVLVTTESPSSDLTSCRRVLDVAADLVTTWTGAAPQIRDHLGNPVLTWGPAQPRVLLLGHLDTVWPLGTLERLPWTCDGERLTGPGVFDMKAGVVQALTALRLLGTTPSDGVGILLTTDEEIGSLRSRDLIESMARDAQAVLVFEAAIEEALKTGRKGTSWYDIEIRGRAAHAGLDPERGINALVEAATLVHDLVSYAAPARGTTVTPTLARAGVTSNTVPDHAFIGVDVRAWTADEQQRVDDLVRAWRPGHGDASVAITGGGINRPAMEEVRAADLFARAALCAVALGLPEVEGRAVGGASDGNFTAALGVATLDGLGAVGDGAHADHEWVSVRHMPERAALVAALVADVLESSRP